LKLAEHGPRQLLAGHLVVSRQGGQSGGEDMEFKSGDRVQVESESTERPPRTGVVEEVVQGTAHPRYRIRWDDGHESIYTPAAGALHSAEPTEKRRRTEGTRRRAGARKRSRAR
jgi:hypothetical protein